MEKVYAVHVQRISTDYVLIHAESGEEAKEKVELLMAESSPVFTLGEDGVEDTITGVEETAAHGQHEDNDLDENDTLHEQCIEDQGAFDNNVCPGAPRPLVEGETAHKWNTDSHPITCNECGAEYDPETHTKIAGSF